MPPSRPSRYCFGLQDDSVFADFDLDEEGRVFLLRISFDGWGCYGTANESVRMTPEMSKRFVTLVESNKVESEEFAMLLLNYFRMNKDVIRNEPLIQHGLFKEDK